MGKNVAVFVDVANIFYAAKAAGVDIDYVTLLKSATAGRDFVRAYAYTGLDPDNENQRNFHSFLARNHYKVVSKDIRKYGDGKVKANLDIELVVDLMKTARNLDVAIVVSGDGDFAPAIRAVQEMGVRVEVISFRGNTSSDLIEVADLFTDITQLARVEKGSSRSGRRVAGDDEDLSMTEVPDKQTEGSSTDRRGRGRGRGRTRPEAEPVAARRSSRSSEPAPAVASSGSAGLLVLPGEKLSRAAAEAPAAVSDDEAPEDVAAELGELGEGDEATDGAGRRRRRRGGRGRGRGRGRDGETTELAPIAAADAVAGPDEDDEEVEVDQPLVPSRPRSTPFGSVWDSQLGVQSGGPVSSTPFDDEDFEEPAIPEYLIAEQRRGQAGRGAGNRSGGGRAGARSAYNAAIERERYGRGGGGGGINRYPDVSGREREVRGDRPDRGGRGGRPAEPFGRGPRPERPTGPRSSSEPWSEVPPELEEMLRAQLASSGRAARPARETSPTAPTPVDAFADIETLTEAELLAEPVAEPTAPKRRTSTRRTAASAAPAEATLEGAPEEPSAPKRRASTRKKAEAPADASPATTTEEAAAPKRRASTRKKAEPAAETEASAAPSDDGEAPPTPKRRTTRRKTTGTETA